MAAPRMTAEEEQELTTPVALLYPQPGDSIMETIEHLMDAWNALQERVAKLEGSAWRRIL